MEAELTCGFREPYLSRLLAKPPLKRREGRRWYQSAGCNSVVYQIMQSLQTHKRPVRVSCSSDQHCGVTLWYTGYSVFSSDEAAYDGSMVGSTNTWWPLDYDDKASALSKFASMPWKRTGSYKVVLFDVAQEEPAPNGEWNFNFNSWAFYKPPEPSSPAPEVQPQPSPLPLPHAPRLLFTIVKTYNFY